jgi:hypothetical protein
LTVINDILDFSKLEAGKVELPQKKAEREKAATEASRPAFAGSPELDKLYRSEEAAAMTPAQQTAQYKLGEQQSQRNMATGLGTASASGGLSQGMVSKLVQGTNDASMKNLVTSQNLKEQRMNRLGGIVGQKAAEGRFKFQTNQMEPWQMKYSDAIAKGQAGSSTMSAGFQNTMGALGTIGAGLAGKKKKDDDSGTGTGTGVVV